MVAAAGKSIRKVVPTPGCDATVMVRLAWAMMP
jgi:hypothetical protein